MQTAFIRSVSQELHAPIAVLQGYAELLYGGGLGELAPEQQEALFIIVNRAEELKKMVSRIGILMDVQSHRSAMQPLALSAVVAQMVEPLRAKALQEGIRLHVNIAPDLPPIMGDLEQVSAAIDDLIENALKFTPTGGQVHLSLEFCGDWVCLGVTDTGIGLAAEELADLFQSTDGGEPHFDGLRLIVVQKVVEAHNGQIEVQSHPGEGSRFILKFPALADESALSDSVPVDTPPRRILVVDDEEFVVFTLQEGLSKFPHCEVRVAMSGQDALALFAAQPFDLLITDYKMPDMTGVELATRIRQLYPQTVIIMVTAYSNHLMGEPAATASIHRVLNKPVRLSEIRDAVLETLGAEFSA